MHQEDKLETACKYYSLISKLQVDETIQCIEGKRTHETWVIYPGRIPGSMHESVMDSRVQFFESLAADWGPECSHATEGCKIYSKDAGAMVPWVSTFNVPLLESIASGHFFDRTFAPINEEYS